MQRLLVRFFLVFVVSRPQTPAQHERRRRLRRPGQSLPVVHVLSDDGIPPEYLVAQEAEDADRQGNEARGPDGGPGAHGRVLLEVHAEGRALNLQRSARRVVPVRPRVRGRWMQQNRGCDRQDRRRERKACDGPVERYRRYLGRGSASAIAAGKPGTPVGFLHLPKYHPYVREQAAEPEQETLTSLWLCAISIGNAQINAR
mmetsp:Transcript_2689/g.6140  ORF Transcript_2689/g.6140 Transcript_2689/m.6140 type:complete len:201 (+) Transcript_2689:3034-3636(+)